MNKKGFTLIEIVVAMAIASVVMAAIFSLYHAQTRSHRQQQLLVETQQNLRAAVYLLEREVRMAGYSAVEPRAPAGFVLNFSGLGTTNEGSGAAINAANVAFTTDSGPAPLGDNGIINTDSSFEVIAYRHDAANSRLERWDAQGGQWQVAAEKINALTFTYYTNATPPVLMPFPITAANLPNIGYVQVAISSSAGDRAIDLTHIIKCRNTGL